jgi:DNA-directed RNA polymerase subunit RPC12/RpoP
MNFKDPEDNKILTCVDCSKPFVFTAGEQQYFLTHKLSEPKRCPDCRKKRHAMVLQQEAAR